MKPLLFQHFEEPTESSASVDLMEYSYQHDLHVDRASGQPIFDSSTAIDDQGRYINIRLRQPADFAGELLETDTFTKDQGESSDSDPSLSMDALQILMETQVVTKKQDVETTGDPASDLQSLDMLLSTATSTFADREEPDEDESDREWY